MKYTHLSDDPPRWTQDPRGDRPEGRAGERLRAAKALEPRELSARYARARASSRRGLWTRRSLAWAAVWLLFGMTTLTAGAMTAGWWPRWQEPASRHAPDDVLDVPAGSTLRVQRRGRWSGTLEGPGEASLAAGEDIIRLIAGTLTLTADNAPVAVWAGARQVHVAAGASARVEMRPQQEPRVQPLEGQVGSGGPATPVRPAPPVEPRTDAPQEIAVQPDLSARPAARPAPRTRGRQPSEAPPPAGVEAPAGLVPTTEPPAFALTSPAARPVVPEADPPAAVATETAALEAAVRALRREADPRGALRLLDQAEARVPRGDLQAERATLRAEALLELGDKKQALRVLDSLPEGTATFNRRLRVARGELRADQSRCAEAITDFQRVLSPAPHDDEDERALRGQVVCRLNADGVDAARSDLDIYLRLFPDRPFAGQARALLLKSGRAP